jgi:hypothetical protein
MTEEEAKQRNNWHRPIAGPQQPGASHLVGVYGNSSQQAYSRRSEAKPVTFTCIVCGKSKTEYRYPGFKPKYCSDICSNQAAEERNERRVAQQREKRRRARETRAQVSNTHSFRECD